MGLFSRKPKLSASNVGAEWMTGPDWRDWEPPRNLIRGEAQHQRALRKLCGMTGMPRVQGFLAPVCIDLVREPANTYDSNAIAARVNGEQVGYLGRELAAQIAPVLDQNKITAFRVCGVIRGGTPGAPSLGAHVWLDRHPTEGPTIQLADSTHVVAWPPFDGEGME